LLDFENLVLKHLENVFEENYFKPDYSENQKLQDLTNIISKEGALEPDELET